MTLSPPRPFASPRSEPRYARERTFDLRHIRLELAVDPRRRTLQGRATLRLAPLHDGFQRLGFDLASELHVAGVSAPKRARLRFARSGNLLEIDLGRPHPAGRDLEVTVAYSGTPRRGLHFVGPDPASPHKPYQAWTQGQDEDSKSWFPCYDSPDDKATSEILVTVPRPFRAISNGRLVATRATPAGRFFHWREDFPHPAYLVSLVVGEFAEVTTEVDGIPVQYYVPPHEASKVQRTFGNTPAMLRFFAKAIDYPYPYEKYAQVAVQDFVFGGMENLTATTLTDAVLLDATSALDFHSDSIIAHELAHQWWGNSITCKEWSHAWLNEGFATYFDALFTEHHRGRDEFLWVMSENARDYFQEDEEKYRRPIVERRYSKPIEIFDRHLYEKGALVLHLLRHELGDNLFWKAIRHYARKYQFQNVETADFKMAIEAATGRPMDRFFDQWVYGTGFPRVSATWSWREPEKSLRLVIRQTQAGEESGPVFHFPLDVEIATATGMSRHRLQVDSADPVFSLPCPDRPRWVRVDPEHRVLMKLQVEPTRDELLAQLGATSDFFAAADAASGLGRFVGDAAVRRALAAALGQKRFFAAKRAIATALARLGDAEARAALVAALAERDLRARRGIVRALGEFTGDPVADAALRRAWRTEKSYFVRAEILSAVARIRAPRAFEFLARGLAVDSFRDIVRAAALRGLAEIEDVRGIDLALPWAVPGQSRWARDAAMRALAVLGRLHPAHGRTVQDAIERTLREPLFFAQLSAIGALGSLGRSQALPALRRIETADVDGRLQRAAREAAEAITSGTSLPEPWRALRGQVEQLRVENRDLRARLVEVESKLATRPSRAAPPAGGRRRATPQRRPRKRSG